MVKIIKRIEEVRIAKGWTRQDFADLLGHNMTKEKLDKIVENAKKGVCPLAFTVALMLEKVGLPTMPPELFKDEEER